jgi:F420-dependent oxidoreductase-like protein
VRFGVQLQPDHCTWEEIRDAALLAERLGYELLFSWDHFIPLRGDTTGRALEAWQILPAWGALTNRVRIGMLVTGNTYRNPGVLAKMAITLDHITNGRGILGLGAAWNEAEHRMYGIDFDTAGIRLAKLDESCRIIRSLLENSRTTFKGKYYAFTDAIAEPKAVQKRLPILIGGGGERKTLRTTAKYADMWHGFGPPSQIAHKIEVLRAHCAAVGRDPTEIEITSGFDPGLCLRDSEAEVQERRTEVAKRIGSRVTAPMPVWRVDDAVKRLHDYEDVGVTTIIFGMGSPFDIETMQRFARQVRPKFQGVAAA